MQILVTGGAGYIGSVVCEKLHAQGHALIVIDDLRDGNKKALTPGAVFYEANFANASVLDQIFSSHNIEFVIHLAASANVPDSVLNPLPYYQNNVAGTIILLQKMQQYGVKKIIFSSTAAVYGEPQFIPITEAHPLVPVNPYGWSKLFDEQIIKDCANAYGFNFFIFRYFCAAGATAFHGESRACESHLIPLAIDTAIGKRESLSVFGNNFNTIDGSGVRDYIHVEDIAQAHLLCLNLPLDAWNKIFNLGTSKGFSVFEIIKATEQIMGKKLAYKVVDKRPGDPASLIAHSEYAFKCIGWKPHFSLEQIIDSAYHWRANPLY
jgi:UDP-glucose 4-epimerase